VIENRLSFEGYSDNSICRENSLSPDAKLFICNYFGQQFIEQTCPAGFFQFLTL
jgi:hypothetical protein